MVSREIIALGITVHGFEQPDLERCLGLIEAHPGLDRRDAVHAACALGRDIELIVSTDPDLDLVDGLRRIDPADEAALAALASG